MIYYHSIQVFNEDHISLVKFTYIIHVSTDPLINLKQPKSPKFENMST